jgi:hypothetical protein
MIDPVRVAAHLYGWCVSLFPPEFQREFGEELRGVFSCQAREAIQKSGYVGLLTVCWRELRDLPTNILREHAESLRKKVSRKPLVGVPGGWRLAGEGAIGFGTGMAIWILMRWLLDPTNSGMFTHYWAGLFRETVMFGFVGAIGWFMISRPLFPTSKVWQLVKWGATCGAAGGLGATLFVNNSFRLLTAHPGWHFPGYLIQTVGALICGAGYGMPILWEASDRKSASLLILLASAFFGIGFWISEVAFLLYFRLNIPMGWRMHFWGLPLAISAAIDGLVAGGLLAWLAGRIKPRLPKPEPAGKQNRPSILTSDEVKPWQYSVVDPMVSAEKTRII